MAEVTVYMNGRPYDIACDTGQEGRVTDLAAYVDQRLQKISRSGGAYNETNLLVLATIVLADEIYELRQEMQDVAKKPVATKAAAPAYNKEDETLVLRVLEQMTQRIDGIVNRVQDA